MQMECSHRYLLSFLSGDKLLSAVNVISCACEGGVSHDVNCKRGNVTRTNYTFDRKCGPQLLAAFFKIITEQFCRQRRVNKTGSDEIDPNRCEFERKVLRHGWSRRGKGRDECKPFRRLAPTSTTHEKQC